ncbi:MAG: hypothetical protein AAF921_10065 [Cyanobacteria bacterium P01_D01_bin.44]
MKRTFLTALALTAATVAIAPVANAAEIESTTLQQRRYEVLENTSSKAIEDVQSARLEALDARSKGNVHTLRIEHLDSQSKAVDNIQSARLGALDARTKGIDNIQSARLEHLDTQSKAVEDIQATRLGELDARSKGIVR